MDQKDGITGSVLGEGHAYVLKENIYKLQFPNKILKLKFERNYSLGCLSPILAAILGSTMEGVGTQTSFITYPCSTKKWKEKGSVVEKPATLWSRFFALRHSGRFKFAFLLVSGCQINLTISTISLFFFVLVFWGPCLLP